MHLIALWLVVAGEDPRILAIRQDYQVAEAAKVAPTTLRCTMAIERVDAPEGTRLVWRETCGKKSRVFDTYWNTSRLVLTRWRGPEVDEEVLFDPTPAVLKQKGTGSKLLE